MMQMVAIPKPVEHPTVEAIYQGYVNKRDPMRGHLGASLIGRECERELWYGFHWVLESDFTGRILRLFQRGQLEEKVFEDELRLAGVHVQTIDPKTNKQFKVSTHGGHFSGSMDGIAEGILEAPKTAHVLEFKTHSDKSFKDLTKNGVEKAKPEHFAQMQVYMRLGKLTRAFYLAVNKNDDSLYSERFKLDKTYADQLIDKALSIITAEEPPKRISENPSWYKCKFCNYNSICHGEVIALTNCRTCKHSTPVLTGNADWSCTKHGGFIPIDFQRKGCDQHQLKKSLGGEDLTFAALKKSSVQG